MDDKILQLSPSLTAFLFINGRLGQCYLHLLLRIGVQAQYKCAGYRLAATVHTGGDRQRAIGTDCRETGRNGNHAVITGGSDLHLLALTGGLERKTPDRQKCCVPLP